MSIRMYVGLLYISVITDCNCMLTSATRIHLLLLWMHRYRLFVSFVMHSRAFDATDGDVPIDMCAVR